MSCGQTETLGQDMEEVMEQLRISQDTVFPHIRVTATGPADMVTAGK